MKQFREQFKSQGLGFKTQLIGYSILLFGMIFSADPLVRRFEAGASSPFKFKMRSIFGRSPAMDSRIKVISFDDEFISRFGSYDAFTKEYWNVFISKISESNPRAIVIDALLSASNSSEDWYWFDSPYGKPFDYSKDVKVYSGIALFQRFEATHFFSKLVSPLQVSGISAAVPGFQTEEMSKSFRDDLSQGAQVVSEFWGNKIIPAGHLSYDKNTGRFDPIKRVQDFGYLPHLGVAAVGGIEHTMNQLWVNGFKVPLYEGMSEINFLNPDDFRKRQYSAAAVLDAVYQRKKVDWIDAGDYVFIAPLMWTGHTDKGWTPFGNQDGALSVVSILNSSLSGQWIRELSGGVGTIAVLGGGAYAALFLIPLSIAGPLLLGLFLSWLAGSFLMFSIFSLSWPIFYPLAIVASSVAVFYARKVQIEELAVQSLKQTLYGKVPDSELERSIRRKFQVNLEPQQHVISIMFIDIVGYSAISQDISPLEAFHDLKKLLDGLRGIIHKYDGVIDKTLGDGLLAYFGYSLAHGKVSDDHALKAVKAALEIQKISIEQIAAQVSERVYPLRIGINTTTSLIGNLGDESHFDVTLIGHGVNVAKRLEGSAEPHHVVVSALTWDLVASHYKGAKVSKKQIQLKYHDRPQEAFQILSPDISENEFQLASVKTQVLNFKRRAQLRFDVIKTGRICLMLDLDELQILNFSLTGIRVRSKKLMNKTGVHRGQIKAESQMLQQKIDQIIGDSTDFTLHWSVRDGEHSILGISFSSLDRHQQEQIYSLFSAELL